MDSICSLGMESFKLLTVIRDVIRTSQAILLTCHSNSFLSSELRKNKNNFEHIQVGEAQKLLADSHKPVSSLYNLNT
jgi:hypothetical protein